MWNILFFPSLFHSWLEHPSYFHLFHSQLILICAFAVWRTCAPRLLLNISLYYFSRGPPKHKPPPPMKSGSSTEMVSGHFFPSVTSQRSHQTFSFNSTHWAFFITQCWDYLQFSRLRAAIKSELVRRHIYINHHKKDLWRTNFVLGRGKICIAQNRVIAFFFFFSVNDYFLFAWLVLDHIWNKFVLWSM